mgnify:CR=1 FL=1
MSNKIPELIFSARAENEKLLFRNPEDVRKYCIEHSDEDLLVHIQPLAKTAPKLKMYAFYYVNILECAVIGYTNAGYEGVDKVTADYLLRAQFAKDYIRKPDGTYEPIMLDKRNMSKARLLKLLQDSIMFIENDLGIEVADSEEYKVMKATKRNFKKV